MTHLVLPAPAKLNLFLHITGRREDGYHLLQTVFQMLDYCDEINLQLRNDGKITRTESSASIKNIPFDSDLCVRAAKLIQSKAKNRIESSQGVDITLIKKLPIGGGIGGGSSNAATVLHGLNKLWECNFNTEDLAAMGLQLGADVPVFIKTQTAWAEGVGEQLIPIKLEEKWFVVIPRFLEGNRFNFLHKDLSNVFESVVTKKHPEIAQALDWLSKFSLARLTGTGSCIFAAFESKQSAQKVIEALDNSNHNWFGFVAKGLNQSPLLSALQN